MIYAIKARIAFLTIALCLCYSAAAHAICGDSDGNGQISTADIVYGMEYLYDNGPPPPDFEVADFDLAEGLSISDFYGLWMCIFGGCIDPDAYCPPTGPPLSPPVDSSFVIQYPEFFPPNRSNYCMYVRLNSAPGAIAIQLSYRVLLDGQPVQIDSVRFIEGSNFEGGLSVGGFNGDSSTFACGSIAFFGTVGPVEDVLEVYLSAPTSTEPRPLTLVSDRHIPINAPAGHDDPVKTMVHFADFTTIVPVTQPSCCVIPGDGNLDYVLSIADAVYIINRIFGGWNLWPCPSGNDADSNGQVSIGDAVYVINYIFAGGPAPQCGP